MWSEIFCTEWRLLVNMRSAAFVLPYLTSMLLLQGCDKERSKPQRDDTLLENALWVDSHPVVGRSYTLKDPNALGGVRSTREPDLYYIPRDPDVTVAVLIGTDTDYSDGELLKIGLYTYEGNKMCEIDDIDEIADGTRTVRRDVKCRYFTYKRLTAPAP